MLWHHKGVYWKGKLSGAGDNSQEPFLDWGMNALRKQELS